MTPKSFEKLMGLVQFRESGESFSRDYLIKKSFSSHLANAGIATMKFLGFLDETGKLTGSHSIWLEDGGLEPILKKAYGPFHLQAKKQDFNDEDGSSLVGQHWQVTDPVKKQAWRFYHHLVQRNEKQAGGSVSKTEKSVKTVAGPALAGGAQVVFSLQVTKHTSEKDIVKMLRTVDKATFIYNKKHSGASKE